MKVEEDLHFVFQQGDTQTLQQWQGLMVSVYRLSDSQPPFIFSQLDNLLAMVLFSGISQIERFFNNRRITR